MASSSSSVNGRLRSSISFSHRYACNCSGVIAANAPGVGVANNCAFKPTGVDPPGVNNGVAWPGVADGVIDGVAIPLMFGVIEGVAAVGVSSHRERLFDAVADSMIRSSALRSAFGVSSQPELWPGVSRSVRGVSSQRFRRVLFSCAGVSSDGVEGTWAGVASHRRAVRGVAPGVWASLPNAGVFYDYENKVKQLFSKNFNCVRALLFKYCLMF